ncbi:uncharacterized protein LOC143358012 [Halictus rubicundus]|uniref:uncharacterized protein LOC143358012 n=1 Tax=Halictus rubicundus TaxID=77578 RepID=UPI004035BE05
MAARTVTKLTLLEQLNIPTIDLHVLPYDEASPPLLLLTGPSAVKKMSLAQHVVQTLSKKIKYCPWYTTKELGDSKLERQSYIFANREEFNDMSRRGEFLAIQEMLGNSYGFHHNQIASLISEKKIGITQMDLHAAIQMCRRYSNAKPILVLTKSEKIHRSWIKEKFDVYTCIKESTECSPKESKSMNGESIESEGTVIHEDEDDSSNDAENFQEEAESKNVACIHESSSSLPRVFSKKSDEEIEEKKYIKFEGEQLTDTKFIDPSFSSTLDKENDLRVILDKGLTVEEDEVLKRKRHQAKLMQRRSTLLHRELYTPDNLSESGSSEETLFDQFLMETRNPEYLKEMYTDLVIKTRTMYLKHHVNNPGFFCLVLLTDEYKLAFNRLINIIYKSYTGYSTEQPKFFTETEHFSQVAIPAMVNTVTEEIRQSLSSSKLQTKTWLRTYGVTSFKKLMPSQMSRDSKKCRDANDD